MSIEKTIFEHVKYLVLIKQTTSNTAIITHNKSSSKTATRSY
jgi:hypothetical protein